MFWNLKNQILGSPDVGGLVSGFRPRNMEFPQLCCLSSTKLIFLIWKMVVTLLSS